MRKLSIAVIIVLMCCHLGAQDNASKVAVFASTDEHNTGYAPIFREVIIEKLAKSKDFKPVERELIDQVLRENEYQQTGMVDDSKIKEMGKQMGADYVCISSIMKIGDNYFVSAKLVDIITALIEKQENTVTQEGSKDLYPKMGEVAAKLLGVQELVIKSDPGAAPVNQFTDPRDGTTYQTIRIKGKIWMAENLNYDIGEGSFHYKNDDRNGNRFGRLYTYEAALVACPKGWHLPTENEWRELASIFGGANDDSKDDGRAAYNALIQGGEAGLNIGFAGFKHKDRSDDFKNLGSVGYFWSATAHNSTDAWRYLFEARGVKLIRGYTAKGYAYSCRCVKD